MAKTREEERRDLLLRTAHIVAAELKQVGDVHDDEIIVDPLRIQGTVDDYFSQLDAYKRRHNFDIRQKLVASPKIAAFTAACVMANRPFVSTSRRVESLAAAIANEALAWRLITIFLRLRINELSQTFVEEMLFNLSHGLIDTKSKVVHLHFIETWLVSFMALLAERHGNVGAKPLFD